MSVEENKAIVRRYREIHNSGQLDQLTEIVADALSSHELMPGVPPGREGGKMVHQGTLAVFPDIQVRTDDLFAEGDLVVERWTQSMTHTGAPFFIGNVPATGKHVEVGGISLYRIADGKIVEHWANMDFMGVMQQLGLIPAAGA